MTQREAFEAWYCAEYWNFKASRPKLWSGEEYDSLSVQLAWMSWQSAQAQATAPKEVVFGGPEVRARMLDAQLRKHGYSDIVSTGGMDPAIQATAEPVPAKEISRMEMWLPRNKLAMHKILAEQAQATAEPVCTCPFCGDTYPDFDVAHVCSRGPYAMQAAHAQATKQHIYPGGGDATAQATQTIQSRNAAVVAMYDRKQATAEPVAFGMRSDDGGIYYAINAAEHTDDDGYEVPLYTAPPDHTALLDRIAEMEKQCKYFAASEYKTKVEAQTTFEHLKSENERLAGLLRQALEALKDYDSFNSSDALLNSIKSQGLAAIESIRKVLP